MQRWPTQILHGLAVFGRIAASSHILQGLLESERCLFVTFLLGGTSEVSQIGSQNGGGDIHLQLRGTSLLPYHLSADLYQGQGRGWGFFPASKGGCSSLAGAYLNDLLLLHLLSTF